MDDVEALAEAQKILHVLQRAVAPPAVKVHHKGRAADGGKHHVIAAKAQILGAVARGDGEGGGHGGQAFGDKPCVKVDHVAVHPRAGAAEIVDRAGVQDAHPLFGQKAQGGGVNGLDVVLAEDADRLIGARHLTEGALGDGVDLAGGAALAHHALLWLGRSRRGGRSGSPRRRA